MNGCHEHSWFRTGLLLLALSAGSVVTQLVPPYREIAFMPEEEESVSASASANANSTGPAGIDVSWLHLNVIRNTG